MAESLTDLTRRHFLGAAAATASSAALAAVAEAQVSRRTESQGDDAERGNVSPAPNAICCFEKPLQWMDFEQLADTVAAAGYDGIEATVRDGGHVAPQRVEDDLPKMVAALKQRDLKIHVLASSINDANDALSEKVLRTAARLGVPRYRLKYYKYDLRRPVLDQAKQFASRLRELATLNAAVGIQGVYQNHSGRDYFGAPVWDLALALQEIDPQHLGVAFDIRHATVEGGTCWPIHFNLVRPRIGIVYVKDYLWKGRRAENVPLGQGQVDPQFFRLLKGSGYDGPISVHVEYHEAKEAAKDPEPVVKAIRDDLTTLRRWLS
jgi:sugar phosphate isomerase/epimerase